MTQANSSEAARADSFVVLGLLSTFGPISLDLYLPALPQLAAELEASTSAAQLTITLCLIGLAVGQIIAGPAVGPVRAQASADDRTGRVRARLAGLRVRLVDHGAAGAAAGPGAGRSGAGIVIARAVARDLYEGRRLVVFFSRLVLVSGLAPVIAPVLGGQLNRVMTWRGIFGVLAGIGVRAGAGRLAGSAGEPAARAAAHGGLGETLRGFGVLVRDRFFVGRGAGRRPGRRVDVRLHRRRDLRPAADLRAQSAGVLAGLRPQLGGDHGGCPAERPADPEDVAGAGPRHRPGGRTCWERCAWRPRCCSASDCRSCWARCS